MEKNFVGTVEEEVNGDLHIEGYLFDSPSEAQEFMAWRFKRAVNRILTLTLGKFEALESHSSR